MLDFFESCAIIQKSWATRQKYGGIAQLGERLNGIQEVGGSIPLNSTISVYFKLLLIYFDLE